MADRDAFHQRPFSLPPGATEVILVRHGASEAAIEGVRFPVVDGRADPALSDAGAEQAEAVAERLAAEGAERIYVSTLRRTQETARPLADATGLEPTVLADLTEVYLGIFDAGEYRVRVARNDPIIQRVFAEQRWDAIPEAESFESLGRRVRGAVERIVAETGPDATAIAVAHGAVIGELCRQATESRPFAFVHADNGSLSRLIVQADGGWLLRSFNDISHLTVTTGPAG
jgi:2,3-bisphosphoglycerate-dependent phosphoglycerate mutase